MKKKLLPILLASLAAMQVTACNNTTSVPSAETSTSTEAVEESETVVETENTETEAETMDNTDNTVLMEDQNGEYDLDIWGKKLKVHVPEKWVVMATDAAVQCEPDSNLRLTYRDSLVPVGDMDALKTKCKKDQDANGKEGQFDAVIFKDGKGYVLAIENKGYNKLWIYEPVEGYDNYLLIDIQDIAQSYDIDELVSMFSQTEATDVDAHFTKLRAPGEPATTMNYIEGKGYEVSINNMMYTVPVPKDWVTGTSEDKVITGKIPEIEEPTMLFYGCSWVEIGDEDGIDHALKGHYLGDGKIEKVNINTPTGEGVMAYYDDGNWDTAIVFQPVESAGMYYEIDITSHSPERRAKDLISDCLFEITPVK